MGSRIKHEIKALTFHEVGVKIDDALDSAKMEFAKFKGGQETLAEAMKHLEGLCSHVDNDTKSGIYDLQTAGHVKKYITRSIEVLRNMGIQCEVGSYTSQGKIQAFQKAVGLAKNLYDTERAAAEAVAAAEAETEGVKTEPARPGDRDEGKHPGDPLADRREPKVSQEDIPPSKQEAEAVDFEPVPVPAVPAQAPKRGRRKAV
jgi:hypothetical protein